MSGRVHIRCLTSKNAQEINAQEIAVTVLEFSECLGLVFFWSF